jgi:hypothetical protein
MEKFLEAKEVADRCFVTVGTLFNWRERGKGPPWKQLIENGKVLYPAEAFEQWFAQNGVLKNIQSEKTE